MNLACVICGFNSGSVVRRVAGCVTFSWCICLFLTTAVCCWVPFCTFRCMDIEIICRRCGYVKVILQAECFWNGCFLKFGNDHMKAYKFIIYTIKNELIQFLQKKRKWTTKNVLQYWGSLTASRLPTKGDGTRNANLILGILWHGSCSATQWTL